MLELFYNWFKEFGVSNILKSNDDGIRINKFLSKYGYCSRRYGDKLIQNGFVLINDEKAAAIIKHISYKVMDDRYGIDVFTENTIKGHLGTNAMKTKKHLYDYIKYDSTNEKRFVMELETNKSVALYIKLPDRFYISTPVGHYNPDWAIAFREEAVKHVYFVAETKGSMNSMQLRLIEEAKIHCAREHFKAISNGEIVYDVVDSFESLWNIVSNN